MGRVLLVDDEPSMRKSLASNLRQDQHDILEVARVEEAQRCLADADFDVVVTSQRLPDGEGLAVIAAARETDPTISVVFLAPIASIELAYESLRHSSFDFLTNPCHPEVTRATVRRACERTLLLRENLLLKNRVRHLEGTREINGETPVIREVCKRIAQVDNKPGFEPSTLSTSTSFDLTALLEQTERELIVRTLSATGGAQAEAARRMGLSRSALAYKLNKYGIRFTA